ncbi:MAG TPA: hypothetical protein VKE24_07510 [Candidatus Acidoferrales bacterium]|nr:hypothetical protein [Candidatus Acidoferrales bacterium]
MKPMDIRALLLINTTYRPGNDGVGLAGPPLALLDVAGKSALERTVEQLEQSGISQITAVIDTKPFYHQSAKPKKIDCKVVPPELFWRSSESAFHGLAQSGAELVLAIRLGPYVEIVLEQLVQFHLDRSNRVTRMVHHIYAPEVFLISASQGNDAASLFRSGFSKCRSEWATSLHAGYVNPLADVRDLRQFAVDILTLKTETQPEGRQARPGVWIAPGAVIETGSRILAPAYIGSSARIGAGALVTRCTAIEHHAHVDCGTVVENSTVLPHSYVGAGLDLAHSVVGMGQIANLRRSTTVNVADEKLIGHVSSGAGRRLITAAADVLSSLGRELFGGRSHQPEPSTEDVLASGPSVRDTEPARNSNVATEFPTRLAVARRYGDD